MIKKLTISNFGMLKTASFEYKDLNIFVGPQATGKSLTLQLIKLIEDKAYITDQLKLKNYNWNSGLGIFSELYFGEGMQDALSTTEVFVGSKKFEIEKELSFNKAYSKGQKVKCFYIPAQRVLLIEDGWPKAFESFDNSYPYVLREFSDLLRSSLNRLSSDSIFPYSAKLKKCLKDQIGFNIFHNADIKASTEKGKKRILLNVKNTKQELPMTLISAGQREFLPYLISLYYLLPAGKVMSIDEIKTIIIEEPEMGLHPQAIRTFFLSALELLSRGYRVFISTHSVDLMNYIWALREITKGKNLNNQTQALLTLLGVKQAQIGQGFLSKIIQKKISVHYFNQTEEKVKVEDISDFHLEGEDSTQIWGGLLSSAELSSDIIASL